MGLTEQLVKKKKETTGSKQLYLLKNQIATNLNVNLIGAISNDST